MEAAGSKSKIRDGVFRMKANYLNRGSLLDSRKSIGQAEEVVFHWILRSTNGLAATKRCDDLPVRCLRLGYEVRVRG